VLAGVETAVLTPPNNGAAVFDCSPVLALSLEASKFDPNKLVVAPAGFEPNSDAFVLPEVLAF